MNASLPIIDLSADDATIAAKIDEASRQYGFFYLAQHGVDAAIIDDAFEAGAQFFALPLAQKQAIAIAKSPHHRGWFRHGEEILDPAAHPEGDYKEGIKIGRECAPDHPRMRAGVPLHGPNQWPDIDGWRATMQAAYDACSLCAQNLMRHFATALDLSPRYFDQWLEAPMATLTPLSYPPQHLHRIGAGAHSDFGCLTLLAQRDIGGLEIKQHNGSWLAAPPIKDTFVVNIGDMLARWTNDIYKSTQHRVINRNAQTRYSMAFFFDPDPDADITPLASCCGDGGAHYPPSTALAHLLEKIDASFAYRQ